MRGARRGRGARMRSAVAILMGGLAAACGSDITSDGCCGNLPGGDAPSLSDLFGNVLYRANGSQTTLVSLQTQSVIGIYFMSRTCPACGSFTPELVATYDAIRAAGKPFEIVLASVDPAGAVELTALMQQYKMGWLALPLGSDKIMELAQRYDVAWIPTLVVINAAAKTITKTGREDVMDKGAGAFDQWVAASPAP